MYSSSSSPFHLCPVLRLPPFFPLSITFSFTIILAPRARSYRKCAQQNNNNFEQKNISPRRRQYQWPGESVADAVADAFHFLWPHNGIRKKHKQRTNERWRMKWTFPLTLAAVSGWLHWVSSFFRRPLFHSSSYCSLQNTSHADRSSQTSTHGIWFYKIFGNCVNAEK